MRNQGQMGMQLLSLSEAAAAHNLLWREKTGQEDPGSRSDRKWASRCTEVRQ